MNHVLDPLSFIEALWDKDTEFQYMFSGSGVLSPDHNIGPYTFDSHLISVVSKGAMECVLDGQSIAPGEKSVLWVNAMTQYHLKNAVKSQETIQLWFRFRVKYRGEYLMLDQPFALHDATLSGQQLSRELLPNRALAKPYWEAQRLKSVVSSMLSHIFEEPIEQKQGRYRGLYPNQKRFVIDYIDRHLTDRFYLDDLAKHVNMHKTYLSSQFKKSFGMSVQAYIKKTRIEKSAALMLKHQYRVNEISKLMGYDNDFFFSRQFKDVMGISPSFYLMRENNREKKQAQ